MAAPVLARCVVCRMLVQARHAEQFGVHVTGVTVDFGKVMERMRRIRASISKADSAKRFAQQLGVDVYQVRPTAACDWLLASRAMCTTRVRPSMG